MMVLELLSDFKEGDLIKIAWDPEDEFIQAEVIKIERGFVVYLETESRVKGVFRPGSPYKIEKSEL